MKKRSSLPGIFVLSISAVSFGLLFIDISSMKMPAYLYYISIIFTLLGIISGISVGKKSAYIVHDKKIISKKLRGKGVLTKHISIWADISLLIGVTISLGWIFFTVFIGFFVGSIEDVIFLGYIRYLPIISMLILIYGSYLFFYSRASNTEKMLSSLGKKVDLPVKTLENVERKIEHIESNVSNILEEIFKNKN